MPRQSRIDAPGALHHVIIRAIVRKAIFKDDADRTELIESFLCHKDTYLRELTRYNHLNPLRQDRVKGDERISGDGEFVQSVLDRCHEDYSRRQRRVAQGVDLKTLSHNG